MQSPKHDKFVRVEFTRFKAFKTFRLGLKHFNILVGANNAGKSTVLAAFRILAAGMRRATSRRATVVHGPLGATLGYEINLELTSVAEENIFYNYDDSEPAQVVFHLSNQNTLTLSFPEPGVCLLIPQAKARIESPASFSKHFNCPIGFVPILGPVDHHEMLFEKEAARQALFNYQAARNFRNIWYHYPDKFDEFRTALQQTWPGMDIQRPEIDRSHSKPRLHMYCPENRIPREIFWAGFGFQVWCQMLTHLIQSTDVSIFLIDEPDIYLHSELQRQLLGLLRNLGPDILIATHSTEIITEADADDIVLVHKGRTSAKRIKDPSQLEEVFTILGSNTNPILTQLAKTRRALFVEGKDFQILGKFARKLGEVAVGNRRDFAVVPVEGFNPERVRNLKSGMETTLGAKIVAAAILDKDYRSKDECAAIKKECEKYCDFVVIHERKEIENFLLVPPAIDRAVSLKLADQRRRTGTSSTEAANVQDFLDTFVASKKTFVTSRIVSERRNFERRRAPQLNDTSVTENALEELEKTWAQPELRANLVPGKEALSAISKHIQDKMGVTITATSIIDAMLKDEIPEEMKKLVTTLTAFSSKVV